jgi:PBP1b-binding outer membrane lipoprotein LpoB
MKRLIYLTAILMTALIFVGCSGMTAEQRKETSDLSKSVGNSAFVGSVPPRQEMNCAKFQSDMTEQEKAFCIQK